VRFGSPKAIDRAAERWLFPMKKTPITVSIHTELLSAAGDALHEAGLNVPDAIAMFLKQVVRQGGLPFAAGAAIKSSRPERGTPALPPDGGPDKPEQDSMAEFVAMCGKVMEERGIPPWGSGS
jgi:addiction module RelB/DinJ family antitoxin